MEVKKEFPWEHVNQDRNRKWLQNKHSVKEAKREYLLRALPCPECNTTADQLAWFYFRVSIHRSPKRSGWLTVCDQCHRQVDFFLEQQDLIDWEHVNSSRNDERLQEEQSLQGAKNEFIHNAIPCPRCNADPNQLSWIYLHKWGDPHQVGWLTMCDQCQLQLDFFVEQQHYCSWDELVDPAISDQKFQFIGSVETAQSRYLEQASSCPRCKTSADQLAWFFYTSPEQDWQGLAGRAGWITVCESCHIQVDFFIEIMN